MDKDLSLIWNEVLTRLEQQSMSAISFNTWYKGMKLKQVDEENKTFYITVPIEFMRTRLTSNSRQLDLVRDCIREIVKEEYEPIIITEDNSDVFQPKKDIQNLPSTRLNPKYVFETFVVGKRDRKSVV